MVCFRWRRPHSTAILALAATAVVGPAEARPGFCLPEYLYAAPGLECSVYFRNVFESDLPQNYVYRAHCGGEQNGVGTLQRQRWFWTPRKADAGREVKLALEAWNDDGLVAAATTTVRVAKLPKDTSRKFSVALFTASISNAHFQDQAYKDVIDAGWTNCIPVGSHKAKYKGADDLPLIPHDGYGGYTFDTFLTYYNITQEEYEHVQDEAERKQLLSLGTPAKDVEEWQKELMKSPLVKFRDGRKVLDVRGWIDRCCGGRPPDIVIIGLGMNGAYHLRGTIPELREQVKGACLYGAIRAEGFIDCLRKEMPDAQFVMMNEPLGCGQDAFGANFGLWVSEVEERRIAFAISHEYEAFVRERNDPKIAFLPFMHAIDLDNAFPTEEVPVHARSKQKVVRQCNAMHPTVEGGRQYGDAVAAWVLWWLGLGK